VKAFVVEHYGKDAVRAADVPDVAGVVTRVGSPVITAAWQALVDRAHAQPGQKVLIHAPPVAWGRPPSNSPSTSAPRWRRPQARRELVVLVPARSSVITLDRQL
jgi:hypothetical protein